MSERICLSCEKPIVDRAKEHVIAEWLLRALDVQYEAVTHAVANGSTDQVQSTRVFTFDAFREGRICEGCNGGWMKDLEDEAKPLLIPLMNAERGVSSLDEKECLIVARWTAKTAAVLGSCIELGKPAPAGTLRRLRDKPNELPDGFGVFAGQQPIRPGTRHFAYIQRNSWLNASLEGAPKRDREMLEGGFKVGVQLLSLSLLCAYLPLRDSRFLVAAGLHVPLWPRGPLFAAHKIALDIPEPYDSFAVLEVFAHTLAVIHPPLRDIKV